MALTGGIEIIQAADSDIPAIEALWREYWGSLGLSPELQGFAAEIISLPGVYAPPYGRLLIATSAGVAAGTAALRGMNEPYCEMKRLYVRPRFRGAGIARCLVLRLIEEARGIGYRDMFCDTLPEMTGALRLYRELGFTETGPYSAHPTPGAIYLALTL